jgi:hypothetical protein
MPCLPMCGRGGDTARGAAGALLGRVAGVAGRSSWRRWLPAAPLVGRAVPGVAAGPLRGAEGCVGVGAAWTDRRPLAGLAWAVAALADARCGPAGVAGAAWRVPGSGRGRALRWLGYRGRSRPSCARSGASQGLGPRLGRAGAATRGADCRACAALSSPRRHPARPPEAVVRSSGKWRWPRLHEPKPRAEVQALRGAPAAPTCCAMVAKQRQLPHGCRGCVGKPTEGAGGRDAREGSAPRRLEPVRSEGAGTGLQLRARAGLRECAAAEASRLASSVQPPHDPRSQPAQTHACRPHSRTLTQS